MNARLFTFLGGSFGDWRVVSSKAIMGDPLPCVDRIAIVGGDADSLTEQAQWVLRGVTSNDRYVTRHEKEQLLRTQAAIGRPECNFAALIPIRKNTAWWAMTQDERRTIFEETSRHIAIGLKYLPGVARRLHHCRDLSGNEPFDFLTFFDFAHATAAPFDDMLAELRGTEEWKYVEREVDIRLERVH